jgi:hypothetical protein
MKNENKLLDYIANNSMQESLDAGLKIKIKNINETLAINNIGELGDLFSQSYLEINKTLNVVKKLLDDRQKNFQSRGELIQKLTKQEIEVSGLQEKVNTLGEKVTDLTNRNNFFKNKLANNDKKFNEDLEKLKTEKDEAVKNISKVTMKETQYKHEIKKLEKEIEDLKIKLRKFMSNNNRDASPIKNTSNKNETLNTSTITVISNNKDFNILENSNFIKNGISALNNVNHMRDFYKLLFEAFNEKTQALLSENKELKNCFSFILKEITQYIEFKKIILHKIAKDSIEDVKNELFNDKIFNLNFNDSKEAILNNFNDVVNIFRFVLIYDFLKIDPSKEFSIENAKKMLNNKKFNFEEIPYYNEIKSVIESVDMKSVDTLKGLLFNSSENVGASSRLSSFRNTNREYTATRRTFGEMGNSTKRSGANNLMETMNCLNKDLLESISAFENKVGKVERDLSELETSDK